MEFFVGNSPSALHLILPESSLEGPSVETDILDINNTMSRYLREGRFRTLEHAMIYVERTLESGRVRRGVVGMVDLEQYDYEPGADTLIRATEGTVLSRIPPRVAVRKNAPIELPHAMVLADDPGRTVIEPLTALRDRLEPVYDFELMEHSGHLRGWLLGEAEQGAVAAALRALYDSMGRAAPVSTEENPAVVFDRAAEKVCRGCALCELCWQKEYTGTFNALNDATPFLLERGRALAKDFPSYFADRCIHLPDFLTAVNGELSAFLLRRQYRRQLEETRRSARGQYAQLSKLLTATAAGLGEVRATAGEADLCRIGAALRPKEGETVCGDTVVSFRTEGGLLCLLLADGMGSGEAARRESALTCRLLEQFLQAGIEPEAAMKTLNAAMALRGAETGSFTTIDLITCRPETGEAAFFKYGAAPSYVKKGGTVRRITGGTLPAGLRGGAAAPDVTRATLEPGSFAVMVSDGVADPGRDEWLQNLLAGWDGEDPQTLAGLILSESVRRENLQDDCGVQVLYLSRESGVKKV